MKNNMQFCNDQGFRSQIEQLLVNRLFGNNSEPQIEGWYQEFIQKYCMKGLGPYMICVRKQNMVSTNLAQYFCDKFFGHDLPVWMLGNSFYDSNGHFCVPELEKDTALSTTAKRVMIIGQDPMRDGCCGTLRVASPWGLHYPIGYKSKHAKCYKHIINPLLNRGCLVYVTDYYKLYFTDLSHNAKDSRKNLASMKGAFEDILKEEINLFKPDHIIVLSKDQNVYQPIENAIGPTIHLPHPNSRFQKGQMASVYKVGLSKII